jgi:hypothetical protein
MHRIGDEMSCKTFIQAVIDGEARPNEKNTLKNSLVIYNNMNKEKGKDKMIKQFGRGGMSASLSTVGAFAVSCLRGFELPVNAIIHL